MALIRAPRSPRELFEAFRFYINNHGLRSILDKVDFDQVGPNQISYSCFAELQSEADARQTLGGYDARRYLEQCLSSPRFQKDLVARLVAAFPEKRRLMFVHVPKCAGSDLTQHLLGRHASIDQRLVDADWFSLPRIYIAIKRLIEHAPFTDDIFLHGHTPLRQYIAAGQVRFGDKVFAVLRDPSEIVISKINYIITRFSKDTDLASIDTRGWLRFIDPDLVDKARTGDVKDLARHILHSPALTAPNTICQYLGRETADSCYALCAQADAELTDIARYSEWLKARWGISAETRRNASVPHISLADFDANDRRRIEEVTLEDKKVFDTLRRGLDAGRSLSIVGARLGSNAA